MRQAKTLLEKVYEDPKNPGEMVTQETRVRRNLRTALTGGRNILTVHGLDPNYHYCWVTDINGKVEHFQEMGYEFEHQENLGVGDVSVDQGKSVGSKISKNVGGGLNAYLMKFPKDEWDAAMGDIQSELDQQEREWKKQLNSGKDGTYGNVTLERK